MLRLRRITASTATALALLAPTALAAQADLRTPDAREAGAAAEATQTTDLRSPDARDAGITRNSVQTTDLRSPDARDAVLPAPPSVPAPAPVLEADDFRWGDAGIGAAGMLSLILLALGGGILATHRRGSTLRVPAR